MNRRQIALKIVLDKLKIPQKVDDFDDRLILQKAVYILQQAGIPLGYHFSWYLRGPYCSTLTSDAYEVFPEKITDDWSVGQDADSKIEKIKKLISSLLSAEDKAKSFENLASILFIINTNQAKKDDIKGITQKMLTAGKEVDNNEVASILTQLTKYGLIL